MLHHFIRDSFAGRAIYHLSGRTLLTYREEQPDYVVPEKYSHVIENQAASSSPTGLSTEVSESEISETLEKLATLKKLAVSKKLPLPNYIAVDFDDDNLMENPRNWPTFYKTLFTIQIGMLTAFVYMASAIYTPGIEHLRLEMNVSQTVATLPLTLFVMGYALGPMVFSPLSENARFGRTSIYFYTLLIFTILQIPTALTTDIAALCVLRFFSGIFASPCLATGGASLTDISEDAWHPVLISTWSIAAVCAPSLGPLIGAILVVRKDYHWPFWFTFFASLTSLLILLFFLPESYSKTILYRKAERLRALTKNELITSEGHIENLDRSTSEMLKETFYRPIEIIMLDPIVLFIDIYLGLIYSIMYTWFEAFPIVFTEVYSFTLVGMGASYSALEIGILVGAAFFIPITYYKYTVPTLRGEEIAPEVVMIVAVIGGILMPVGIFIFGWTATSSIHWIVPMIGTLIFAAGAFIVFQSLFNYFSMSFHTYLASVFAGNALFRSMMAGAFPLFAKALFNNLGSEKFRVAWGSSLLGFICVLMIGIPSTFYWYGPKLRARSKYAD